MKKLVLFFFTCFFASAYACQKPAPVNCCDDNNEEERCASPLTQSPVTYSDLEVLSILAQKIEECSLVSDDDQRDKQQVSVDRSITSSVPAQRRVVSTLYRERRKKLQAALTDLAVRDPLSIHASFDESDERTNCKRSMCVSAVDITFVRDQKRSKNDQ